MALGYRTGILTGVVVSLAAAFVLPRWGRPVAKAAIKGGMGAYESATETLARLRETLEDITAEAAFERAAEHTAATQAEHAGVAPPGPGRQKPIESQPIVTG